MTIPVNLHIYEPHRVCFDNNIGRFFIMEHKRHSAAKAASRTANSKFGTAVFVIASIALIAGIIVLSPLGNYLMEHVVSPLSCKPSSNDTDIVSALKQQESLQSAAPTEPVPTDKLHKVITIDETTFYILQMGAYVDAEAASQHADEIMRMGAGGTVYQDGSIYRVFAAAYADESSLKKVQSQVRSDGFEATPYITESKSLRITLDGDQQAVKLVSDAVQMLNQLPKDLCDLCLSFDKGEIDDKTLDHTLTEKQSACLATAASMEQISSTDISPIPTLLKKYAKNISTFLDEHDTMHTEMISGSLKHLQLSVIIDYILFFDGE